MEFFYLNKTLALLMLLFLPYHAVSQVQYFINCGSSENTTIPDGRNFVGDENPRTFRLFTHHSKTVEDSNQTSDPTYLNLYKTVRVFSKPSTYVFNIPQTVNNTYILRLHFDAFSSATQLVNAIFDVSASGHMLLPGFSPGKTLKNSVVFEFFIRSNDTSGKFRVHFVPNSVGSSVAFVNAIEFLSTNVNITEDTGLHVTPAGNNGVYVGLKSEVLETIYRVNVGGNAVTSSNIDSNLWRTWVPDDQFSVENQGGTNQSALETNINYIQMLGSVQSPNVRASSLDDAPQIVYRTDKAKALTSSIGNNLTWKFNVSEGMEYLIRLHFCDISKLGIGNYIFNLSIFGRFVESIAPFNITSNINIPFYMDYVVDSGNSGVIDIILRPVNGTTFLNGLEIMRVKNESAADPVDLDDVSHSHVGLIVGLVVATVFVVVLVVALVVCQLKRRKREPVIEDEFDWEMVQQFSVLSSHNKSLDGSSSHEGLLHLRLKIPFRYIKQVTNNFDEELIIGEGGFGKVYKGTLKNGNKVAVKRSNPEHGQGLAEFQTEVMVLSKIRHKHLVSLIGYCYEKGEMILVYEFMEKGTLRDHLYDSRETSISSNLVRMSWKQRLEICIGAAKGLHYLHTGAERGIIHRDVKSTNILLDERYIAKVADFGLSRLGHLEETHVSTDVKGTFGYLDPEYLGCMQLTEKSDVYSFGVVLLEVLCARPVIDRSLPRQQINLAEWGMTCLAQGEIATLVEPSLVGEIAENSLQKFVETAAKCLKESAAERPPMSDILWDLEYTLQLQRAATEEQLLGDSMTIHSLEMPASPYFPSQMSFTDNDISLTNTTSEVFSQMGYGDHT